MQIHIVVHAVTHLLIVFSQNTNVHGHDNEQQEQFHSENLRLHKYITVLQNGDRIL